MIISRFTGVFYFLLSVVMTISSLTAGYVRPNTETPFFEKELLTLDIDQRSEIARELSALTRNFPNSPAASSAVRARAMAIALMLDPTNREAVTSNGMFGNGLVSSKVEGYSSYKRLTRGFERLARYLNSVDANEQDKRLGLMMADLVWRLDPQSEVGIAYKELVDGGGGMDWKKILSPDVDLEGDSEQGSDGEADPFGYLRDDEEEEDGSEQPSDPGGLVAGEDDFQELERDDESEGDSGQDNNGNEAPEKFIAGSKPKGKYVRVATMASPPAMGYMSSLTHLDLEVATTIPTIEWDDGQRRSVDKPVGKWLDFAPHPTGHLRRSSAYRSRVADGLINLRKDYEGWPKGYVALVDSPRYGRVSGSLGSLATLVGVDALMRGVDLDDDVIVLGSFKPETGELTGHKELAPALLRLDYGVHESVKRVIVPQERADLYCNVLAAVDSEIALHFQIIAVDSVRDATDLALKPVSGNFKEAIEEFEKIQDLQMRFDEMMGNPHVIKKLAEIIQKCPQHVSARALFRASQMSPYGGATLNEKESLDVLIIMLRPFAHMLEYKLDAISPGQAKAECGEFMMRLYKARRNTARSVAGVVLTSEDFVKELLGFVERKNRSTNSALQQFEEAGEKFQAVLGQFGKFDVEFKW